MKQYQPDPQSKTSKSKEVLISFWKRPNSSNSPKQYLVGEEKSEFLVNLVKKYLNPEVKILEIGCNIGRNLHHLYSAGFKHLSGIEINKEALEMMKKHYSRMSRHTKIYKSSVEDVIRRFKTGQFDLTFTMAVFEHIHPESDWIFSEIARITKQYLITIENEKHFHWRSFPRNYKKIFTILGFRQLAEIHCKTIEGLGMNYYARVFQFKPSYRLRVKFFNLIINLKNLIKNKALIIKNILYKYKYRLRIIPPDHLLRAGKSITGYVKGGDLQLQWLRKFANLKPNCSILDIGCGDGRLASALAHFLKDGDYSSFEVNESYVEFLKTDLSKRYKNFSFIHADIYHSYYNPSGKLKAENYIFPYKNEQFDITLLNSIFTHLLPQVIEHYLQEISRVLKNGGIVLSTYFIGSREAYKLDSEGLSSKDLRLEKKNLMNYKYENYWTRDSDVKEHIVIIDEEWLRSEYFRNKLIITEIKWGYWCGRKQNNVVTQQDMILAYKRV